ncbi:hypothetical protein [Streptomyces canus]|uniref:hypothetical protein n=1 Tax=Streptomyces canus TaxID=58343 RepID=UPI0033AE28A9
MMMTEWLIDMGCVRLGGFGGGGDALVKATGRLIATGRVRLGGCDVGGDVW